MAEWCGPCKKIHPELEILSMVRNDVIFMGVDVDDEQHAETIEKFSVTGMPTFIFMKNGEILHKTTGANLSEITGNIDRLC